MNSKPRSKLITISSILVLYLIIFFLFSQLGFPIRKDEIHYWPVSLKFSQDWVPGVDLLKNYDELTTPLSFIIFGTIEHLFHGGIFAGRLLNLILSFGMLSILVWMGGASRKYLISMVGILVYPYFIGCSTHLYTDVIAAFFVLIGLVTYLKGANWVSCLSFVLAISARQYMLAFPLGIFTFETLNLLKSGDSKVRRGIAVRSLWQGVGWVSIGVWILLWGNFGPGLEVFRQNVLTTSLFKLTPEHSLYFLSCLGFYFVLPEAILLYAMSLIAAGHAIPTPCRVWGKSPARTQKNTGFRVKPGMTKTERLMSLCLKRTKWVSNSLNKRIIIVSASLLLLFLLFPPYQNVNYDIPTMGYMDKLFRMIGGDLFRMAVFYILALTACLRFLSFDLESFFVLSNGLVMLKSHIAWDKYLLPLIVALWFLNAYEKKETLSATHL